MADSKAQTDSRRLNKTNGLNSCYKQWHYKYDAGSIHNNSWSAVDEFVEFCLNLISFCKDWETRRQNLTAKQTIEIKKCCAKMQQHISPKNAIINTQMPSRLLIDVHQKLCIFLTVGWCFQFFFWFSNWICGEKQNIWHWFYNVFYFLRKILKHKF